MPDYKNGKIYKLTDNLNNVYIGSTTQELKVRLREHRKSGNMCASQYMNINKLTITLIENYSCINKKELHKRERFYIENTKCINMAIPTQTMKEWRKKNETKINKQVKDYYNKNISTIKEYQKKYHQENKKKRALQLQEYIICECGKKIKKCSKQNHKRSKRHKNFILSCQ